MKGSVKLPVFIDDARKYVNTTQLRAKYLGASYEAEYCQWQTLHGLGSLMETASLIITPNAFLEGKLIASYPPDPIGDFDVVRATTATRVNSAGLVELVPYNFVTYSQEISNTSFWAHYLANLTANTTTAPDETLTADTIAITGASGSAYQFVTYSGGVHTLSCYFKKINEDNVYMDGNSSSGYYGASFNLTTQATTLFGGGFSPSIESVGNGWYRCSVQSNGSGSGSYGFGVYASGGQSAYIWGAQLNEGTLKDYQKTETRLNIPRLDYSNGTCPSILVEPQRTNISRFVESGTGSFNEATVTAGTSILGLTTFKVTTNNILFGDNPSIELNTQYQANTTYTLSFYTDFSKTDDTLISCSFLAFFPTLGYTGIRVDKATKAITTFNVGGIWTLNSYEAKQIDGEIYRIIATATPNATGLGASRNYISTDNNGKFAEFAGVQLEAGSYATSFISKVSSASVTRNADVISKTGISSLIGQTEGTIFLDFVLKNPLSATNRIISITESVWNTGGSIRLDIDFNQIKADFVNGGSNIGTITYSTTPLQNTRYKVAIAYKENDCQMYVNGVDAGSDTTTGVMPTCSELYLNALGGGFNAPYEASNINATALWKTRLTNTQLAQLTTI